MHGKLRAKRRSKEKAFSTHSAVNLIEWGLTGWDFPHFFTPPTNHSRDNNCCCLHPPLLLPRPSVILGFLTLASCLSFCFHCFIFDYRAMHLSLLKRSPIVNVFDLCQSKDKKWAVGGRGCGRRSSIRIPSLLLFLFRHAASASSVSVIVAC